MAATYTLISSQVLGSSTASVTFSSIPQTYANLVLIASTRDTNGIAGNGNFSIRFNGDTATNYSVIRLRAQGTTPSSTLQSSQTSANMGSGSLDTAGNTANTFAVSEIYIPNYTSTSSKQFFGMEAAEDNSTAGNSINSVDASLYRGTSAIASISVAATTAFAINSSFYLYGIKNS